jgi:glycosyltransferase involved in cell wall biosynthesis
MQYARAAESPLSAVTRVAFINEGVLSHAALQAHFERCVRAHPDVAATFDIVKPPGPITTRIALRRLDRIGDLDLHPLRWRLRYSRAARAIAERRLPDCDVLLFNTQSCAYLAGRVMRRRPALLSVDVTGRQFAALEYWRPRDRFSPYAERIAEHFEARALRAAHGVIAWTEWSARSLRDEYRLPSERVHVVHPGVDIERWGAVPRIPRGSGQPLRLLFVGNATQRKGLDGLRDAIARVSAPVRLDVITEDALETDEGMTVHRGLAAGSPELIARFGDADVLVHPTRADAAPWVVVEGMAAGLPVVATDVGAIRELLGDAGVVVTAGDVTALAAAIETLAGDPAARERLGDAGRRRARERYDSTVQIARWVEIIRAAASQGPPA